MSIHDELREHALLSSGAIPWEILDISKWNWNPNFEEYAYSEFLYRPVSSFSKKFIVKYGTQQSKKLFIGLCRYRMVQGFFRYGLMGYYSSGEGLCNASLSRISAYPLDKNQEILADIWNFCMIEFTRIHNEISNNCSSLKYIPSIPYYPEKIYQCGCYHGHLNSPTYRSNLIAESWNMHKNEMKNTGFIRTSLLLECAMACMYEFIFPSFPDANLIQGKTYEHVEI